MDVKGEAAGVLIVEDFAHHPTAIRATIAAARTRWLDRRLWAVVEPRSNTMRGKAFESELPDALALADAVVLGPVSRAQLLDDAARLDPVNVAAAVCRLGKPARAMSSAGEIAELLGGEAAIGDVILVMSNGSFDGLCGRLLEIFSRREQGVMR
jgi:UDP-N-acetylmuramate: L-alanyl-gamma-D-glutamyl-meso-diaminopimelate ligase